MTVPFSCPMRMGIGILGFLALIAGACTSASPPTTTTPTEGTTTEITSPTSTSVAAPTTTLSSANLPPTTSLRPTTAATTTTTTTIEPLPRYPFGGQAEIAVDVEPSTLNSFVEGGDLAVNALIGQGYAAGVFDIDGETLMLIPELVTELPTVANGGVLANADGTMTIVYTIREEAQWDDGVPISGDDFQFTLDTILGQDDLTDKTNYQDILSSTPGDKTFEFTMARPTMQYELMFDEIIPKHDVEGTDFLLDWNDKRWASAGPFVFHEWTPGESISLVRNPRYWKRDAVTDQKLPYLTSVTFEFMEDTSAMTTAFKARDIDMFSPDPTIGDIEALRTLEPEGAHIDVVSGPVWEHLNFQFGPGRLDRNDDTCNDILEMRLAVAQTLNKDLITEDVLGGQVEPLQSYVDPYSPAISGQAWLQYSFDPVAAAENYAKAVVEAGKECSVVFTTTSDNDARVRTSELLVDMFDEAGIPFENMLEDNALFLGSTLLDGEWDVGEWTWQGSPGLSGLVSIHDVFDPETPPPFGSNFYRWGSEDSSVIDDATERFAVLRDEMNATVDEPELVRLIHEAEAILADNLVIIPLYAYPVAAAVWEDEITGFRHNPTEAGFTWNIEFWHRSDR